VLVRVRPGAPSLNYICDKMELGLKNKKALILGSSSGLGLSIAEVLSQEGCNLILASRNVNKLESIRDQIQQNSKVNCDIFKLDLTERHSVDSFIESLKNSDVNILINNTGGPPPSNTANTQASVWETYVQSIIVNIIKITDIVLPSMKEKKWGRIITITSSGVVQPIDNLLVSNTLRPAITGYMKTLSNEVAQYGITVNSVMPGRIMTDRTLQINQARADKLGITYDEAIEKSSAEIPIKRYGQSDEFGNVVCFLASEKASYITGSNIRVDGGLIRSTW
jgi:3-oxoacyl-[acyl-carrier protein] reductase